MGAGIRFKDATDALEKIYNKLEERDKKAAIGRMLALHSELLHNSRLLNAVNQIDRDKISTVALEANIENPAISERNFVYLTNEIYSDFQDFRENLLQNVQNLTKKVKELIRIITKELAERGERI